MKAASMRPQRLATTRKPPLAGVMLLRTAEGLLEGVMLPRAAPVPRVRAAQSDTQGRRG